MKLKRCASCGKKPKGAGARDAVTCSNGHCIHGVYSTSPKAWNRRAAVVYVVARKGEDGKPVEGTYWRGSDDFGPILGERDRAREFKKWKIANWHASKNGIAVFARIKRTK